MREFKNYPNQNRESNLGRIFKSYIIRQMLHRLILKRNPSFDVNKINRIVGMLIDENFSLDEIIEFITQENELNERIKEADEILAEDQ